MKTIVLTGISGAGKSSVGKFLADLLNVELIDIDNEIEKFEKKSVNEIFAQNGEDYFRKIEAQTIERLFNSQNQIISLGGGAFENEITRKILLDNSVVIYLKASAGIILERLKNTTDRPLLNNNMNLDKINNMINIREKHYKLATFTVLTDNKNIDMVAREILECVNLK